MKDRVAAAIIEEGLAAGKLTPGGLITEGTAGSTGVSLAMLSLAQGCHCFIAMPDDAAEEKATMLRASLLPIEPRDCKVTMRSGQSMIKIYVDAGNTVLMINA